MIGRRKVIASCAHASPNQNDGVGTAIDRIKDSYPSHGDIRILIWITVQEPPICLPPVDEGR